AGPRRRGGGGLALPRPGGVTRRGLGFGGWRDFEVRLGAGLRDEARREVLKRLAVPVIGSDVRKDAVVFAQTNARAAGIGHLLKFERKDVRDFRPPAGSGTLICNPPYGERIGEEKELRGLYPTLGEVLRERCSGWTALVFTGNARLAREIGLEPAEAGPVFNGKIPCRLLRCDVRGQGCGGGRFHV